MGHFPWDGDYEELRELQREITTDFLGYDDEVLKETKTRRTVLRTYTIYETEETSGTNIDGAIFHQRRSRNNLYWEDIDALPLNKVKVDEAVKIPLGHNRMRNLFVALAKRYNAAGGIDKLLAEAGVASYDPTKSMIVDGKGQDLLKRLLDEYSDFWDQLEEFAEDDLLHLLALKRQYKKHVGAVNLFRQQIESQTWDEKKWQAFFELNQWIFGLGLTYRFLHLLQKEAQVGSDGVDGKGADVVDFMVASKGERRFISLVEIKKPETLPMSGQRTDIYRASAELTGGVSQLLSYCHHWETQGVFNRKNTSLTNNFETFHPKAILIVGHLREFADDEEKSRSFELYRRHIVNPEILTFDELLLRARTIVRLEKTDINNAERLVEGKYPGHLDDDVPF